MFLPVGIYVSGRIYLQDRAFLFGHYTTEPQLGCKEGKVVDIMSDRVYVSMHRMPKGKLDRDPYSGPDIEVQCSSSLGGAPTTSPLPKGLHRVFALPPISRHHRPRPLSWPDLVERGQARSRSELSRGRWKHTPGADGDRTANAHMVCIVINPHAGRA